MGVKKSPILQRKDLVAQFESCVKQEIAEHKKHIDYCNERLNVQRQYIIDRSAELKEQLRLYESYVDHIRKTVDSWGNLNLRLNSLEKKIEGMESPSIESLRKDVDSILRNQGTFVGRSELYAVVSQLKEKIDKLTETVNRQGHSNTCRTYENGCRIDDLYECVTDLSNEYKRLKSELVNTVESLEEKTHLKMSELNSHEKRFKDINKRLFLNQKKIEYLITRINRLRGKLDV